LPDGTLGPKRYSAKFRRNESAPLAFPKWGGAHLMREASLGKSFKN
jgi:hypothetical protein